MQFQNVSLTEPYDIAVALRYVEKESLSSSNINEVIKEQFQAFLFFYEEILHTKKA